MVGYVFPILCEYSKYWEGCHCTTLPEIPLLSLLVQLVSACFLVEIRRTQARAYDYYVLDLKLF